MRKVQNDFGHEYKMGRKKKFSHDRKHGCSLSLNIQIECMRLMPFINV